MDPEVLLDRVREEPFQPFRVHLRDGRSFEVRYQHLVLVTRRKLVIGYPAVENPDVAGDLDIVSPAEITRIEPLASASANPTSPT